MTHAKVRIQQGPDMRELHGRFATESRGRDRDVRQVFVYHRVGRQRVPPSFSRLDEVVKQGDRYFIPFPIAYAVVICNRAIAQTSQAGGNKVFVVFGDDSLPFVL
jgi:hypothetical protein